MFSIVLLLLFTPGSCESQSSFFCSINCEQKAFCNRCEVWTDGHWQPSWLWQHQGITCLLPFIGQLPAWYSLYFITCNHERKRPAIFYDRHVFLLYKQQLIIASYTLQHKIFIVYNVKHLTFLVVKNFSSHLCSKWWKSTK